MKFISLFTKAPNHKRFTYEPRFYNPKEEERKEREERIRMEIAREKGMAVEATSDTRSRMTGAFHSARRRSKSTKETLNASLIRLGVLLFLTLMLIAYFTWGSVALYGMFVAVPVYIYIRLKQ